jgi:alpha-galactosidase
VRLAYEGAEAPAGVVVEVTAVGEHEWRWSVANDTAAPRAVDRVALRWHLDSSGSVRMFVNGWQSWSPTGSCVVGRDEDPVNRPDAVSFLRAGLHADPGAPAPGELRSELVTALADDADAVVLGFAGGDRHDGTFRVRGDRLRAEAYLGGATLAPGERRELHPVRLFPGDPAAGLEAWAGWAGAAAGARTGAPYQVGWCTWYHYFHDITEAAFRTNLARAGEWPFELFQLDDGYQAAIGDWLTTNERFPAPPASLAADVAAAGLRPGIWLAPFLAMPDSAVARAHPSWLVQRRPDRTDRPLIGAVNPAWGGATGVLDTTHPEVLAHLEDVARTLVSWGFTYLKLDFTYAPSFEGHWHDPSLTPAQRVRAGYDAVRRGAGDEAFLLGCGAPLGACIGVVDGMRIGPDVAPWWPPAEGAPFADTAPSTRNAWRSTLARSFQHRKLWLNDPDCLMLRTSETQLSPAQVEAWAQAVALSGGMALVSDDLALLDAPARALLADVLAVGAASDAAAAAGSPPVCPDLLDAWTPTTLTSAGRTLTGDPEAGTATSTP